MLPIEFPCWVRRHRSRTQNTTLVHLMVRDNSSFYHFIYRKWNWKRARGRERERINSETSVRSIAINILKRGLESITFSCAAVHFQCFMKDVWVVDALVHGEKRRRMPHEWCVQCARIKTEVITILFVRRRLAMPFTPTNTHTHTTHTIDFFWLLGIYCTQRVNSADFMLSALSSCSCSSI